MTVPRAKLDHSPIRILAALRHAGGVMLGVRAGPALLERMGPIDRVEESAGTIRVLGASHDLTLSADAVSAIVVDRTMRMRDRVLPRVHFLGSDGKPLVSATALDDAAAFEAALAPFGPGRPLPDEPAAPREPATAGEDDPAAMPLRAAAQAGTPVTLAVERPGVSLRRAGTLPEPTIAMGFVNIILPDCHLHLRGGAIAAWTRDEDGAPLAARDADGKTIGLTLET
jgi:putative heme degradation protein